MYNTAPIKTILCYLYSFNSYIIYYIETSMLKITLTISLLLLAISTKKDIGCYSVGTKPNRTGLKMWSSLFAIGNTELPNIMGS